MNALLQSPINGYTFSGLNLLQPGLQQANTGVAAVCVCVYVSVCVNCGAVQEACIYRNT